LPSLPMSAARTVSPARRSNRWSGQIARHQPRGDALQQAAGESLDQRWAPRSRTAPARASVPPAGSGHRAWPAKPRPHPRLSAPPAARRPRPAHRVPPAAPTAGPHERLGLKTGFGIGLARIVQPVTAGLQQGGIGIDLPGELSVTCKARKGCPLSISSSDQL
jgi:hypothetical protein